MNQTIHFEKNILRRWHLRFVLDLASSFEIYDELSAMAHCAFNSNTACHLLNQTLANAQSESDFKFVSLCIGFNLAEVYEEIIQLVRRNSTTKVLDF
jgi:hypothetical protein